MFWKIRANELNELKEISAFVAKGCRTSIFGGFTPDNAKPDNPIPTGGMFPCGMSPKLGGMPIPCGMTGGWAGLIVVITTIRKNHWNLICKSYKIPKIKPVGKVNAPEFGIAVGIDPKNGGLTVPEVEAGKIVLW